MLHHMFPRESLKLFSLHVNKLMYKTAVNQGELGSWFVLNSKTAQRVFVLVCLDCYFTNTL